MANDIMERISNNSIQFEKLINKFNSLSPVKQGIAYGIVLGLSEEETKPAEQDKKVKAS